MVTIKEASRNMICHPLWLFCVPRFNAFRILHRVPFLRNGEMEKRRRRRGRRRRRKRSWSRQVT
jgi:hypothetical protein